MARAEVAGQLTVALQAGREARGCLELLAKLLGELHQGPTANILLAPEWQCLRATIIAALGPFSEARQAVTYTRQRVADVVAFIDGRLQQTELGSPFRLIECRRVILRDAFTFEADDRLRYDTIVYSCPKKSGKTTLNAAVTLWWALTQEAPNEILVQR